MSYDCMGIVRDTFSRKIVSMHKTKLAAVLELVITKKIMLSRFCLGNVM
jgi:hypothetical protein